MRAAIRFQSVGKFLYTQNPFYLISCGLIFYGIHLLIPRQASLESRTLILLCCMAAYTVLMSLTAVCVIRYGKVWDDARSILMILLIGLLGLSASFDELCVNRWQLAAAVAAGCFIFSVFIIESVLLATCIRFASLYRLALYAILALFFAIPVVAGYAIAENHQFLKHWAAPIFSTAMSIGLVTMSPALSRGKQYVAKNGTPWPWPLFPLSPFVVLIVLAIVRAHGIWMSFSSLSGPIAFEPFLLVPFALAIAILILQYESSLLERPASICVLYAVPLLIFCGIGNAGLTSLPIHDELRRYFGSAGTLIAVCLVGFYLFAFLKRVPTAEHLFALSLLALAWFSPTPDIYREAGFQNWMLALLAAAVTLGNALAVSSSAARWLGFSLALAVTVIMLGHYLQQQTAGFLAGVLICYFAMLVLGAAFQGELAGLLRGLSGITTGAAALGLVGWQVHETGAIWIAPSLVLLTAVPLFYLRIVKRRGWLMIAGVNATCLVTACLILSQQNWQPMLHDHQRLSVLLGVACFMIAVGISFVKSGAHRPLLEYLRNRELLREYQIGL